MKENCYTGASQCWGEYNHLTRSILILGIVIVISIAVSIIRKRLK